MRSAERDRGAARRGRATAWVVLTIGALAAAFTFLLRGEGEGESETETESVQEQTPSLKEEEAESLTPRTDEHPDLARLRPVRVRELRLAPDLDHQSSASMDELRRLAFEDPALTLELAREGQAQFEGSPDAAERAWFEARALVELARFSEAQQVARRMVAQYPDSTWALDVRRHLLTHPLGVPSREH